VWQAIIGFEFYKTGLGASQNSLQDLSKTGLGIAKTLKTLKEVQNEEI
jgi:hypothetical protein